MSHPATFRFMRGLDSSEDALLNAMRVRVRSEADLVPLVAPVEWTGKASDMLPGQFKARARRMIDVIAEHPNGIMAAEIARVIRAETGDPIKDVDVTCSLRSIERRCPELGLECWKVSRAFLWRLPVRGGPDQGPGDRGQGSGDRGQEPLGQAERDTEKRVRGEVTACTLRKGVLRL